MYLSDFQITQIKARALSGNQWSALHEEAYVIPEDLSNLKITEIHFHPLDDDGVNDREFEFIELKNIGTFALNLSLTDICRGIQYTFPIGIRLNAGEFIVLASNQQQFNNRYGFNPFGEYEGNLDNAGERIILTDAIGDTLISLRYNDNDPWPTSPDGDGYSLVSKNPNPTRDPSDANYWIASFNIHGSPGADDKASTKVDETKVVPHAYALLQNYPNPFNATTIIGFSIPTTSHVKLEIYNVLGQQVDILLDRQYSAGEHSIKWHASDIATTGVYFYRIESDNYTMTKKLILIK